MSTSIATRAMPDCFHMALYSVKCTGACTRAPSRYRLMVAGTCWLATLFHGSMLTCLILNFVMFGNESRDFLATVGIVQFYPWPAWAYRWTFMESNVCTYIYIYVFYQHLEVLKYFIRIFHLPGMLTGHTNRINVSIETYMKFTCLCKY